MVEVKILMTYFKDKAIKYQAMAMFIVTSVLAGSNSRCQLPRCAGLNVRIWSCTLENAMDRENHCISGCLLERTQTNIFKVI